jgi:hypothetical protein
LSIDQGGCDEEFLQFGCFRVGFSDLHGVNLLGKSTPDGKSGFGFELSFRLTITQDETMPPMWPAMFLQHIASYIFHSSKQVYMVNASLP